MVLAPREPCNLPQLLGGGVGELDGVYGGGRRLQLLLDRQPLFPGDRAVVRPDELLAFTLVALSDVEKQGEDTVAQLWRRQILARGGEEALGAMLKLLGPVSIVALLATLVLLFGVQGEEILKQTLVIALLAVPIIIQVYLNAAIAYLADRQLGVAWCVAGPSALIGASNFFELAVATAIALFGFQSGAALATVVGVLVEVPVMLSVCGVCNRTRGWFPRGTNGLGEPVSSEVARRIEA